MTINIYSSTLETLAKALEGIPFPSATFIVENAALKLLAVANLEKDIEQDEKSGLAAVGKSDVFRCNVPAELLSQ